MRKEIKYFTIMLLFLLIILFSSQVKAIANPAAIYCKELGYNYQIKIDGQGNQYGICIFPDKSECEGWKFFNSKCGEEFAQKIDISKALEATALKLPEKPEQKPRPLGSPPKSGLGSEYNSSDYTVWDWRDPPDGTRWNKTNFTFFDDSHGWLTSIKNQNPCGSCWAFSAIGTVEARYNIYNSKSRLNPDLAEEYLVSNCTENFVKDNHSGYYDAYGDMDCSGGDNIIALDYIKQEGISDESCFPYTASNSNCNNRCSSYNNRLWNLSGVDYSVYYQFTNNELKQQMIDYGPLSIAIDAEELQGSPDENGIYHCNEDGLDHAVVLVGYNYTGNDSTSYWIIKNSWGNWQDNGYGKIGFNECNVTDYITYVDTVNPPNFKPNLILHSPLDNNTTNETVIEFNFTCYNQNATNATCDLIIDGAVKNTTTATNATPTVMTFNLSEGTHNWNITCWEDNLGITNTSETRQLAIGIPIIHLVAPENGTASNLSQQTFSCNITDNDGVANLSLYIWNSSNNNLYVNTTNLSGTSNSSSWDYNFTYNDFFKWNCFGYDTIGESSWSEEGNYSITFDTINPTIEIISPITTLVSDTIWINATWSDELAGIKETKYSITNSSGNQASGNLNTSYNTTQLADGNYTINYTAIDYANNSNSTIKNITVDNTAPSVNLSLSDTSINEGSSVDINCTASDDNGIKNITISYNGNTIEECSSSPCEENNYEPSWTGTKTITCTVYDYAGNSGTDEEDLYVDEDDGGGGNGGNGNEGSDEDGDEEEENTTYNITTDLEKDKKKTKKLAKSDGVNFKIKNKSHTIKVNKIYSDKVNLTISSDTFYITIKLNETKQIDVDNNSLDDLAITLLKIYDGDKVKLLFELLEEKEESEKNATELEQLGAAKNESVCGDTICETEAGENCATCPEDCPCKEGEICTAGKCIKKTVLLWTVIGAILIIAIAASIISIRRKFIFIKYHKHRIIKRRH